VDHTLSLHDALPIFFQVPVKSGPVGALGCSLS
jgi:hypothetical protein